MKFAAIDIGSNTVQMMIAETEGQQILSRRSWLQTTRLGSGADRAKLSPESIQDTVQAVAAFMPLILAEEVAGCRILATSAVRDAANKQELQEAVKKAVPQAPTLEILSGEEEAQTSFLGVRCSISADPSWPVMDLGGSSMELIYETTDGLDCISGDIGAVRAHVNGWTKQEIENIVRNTYRKLNAADTLIGVGGSITTAAGILAGQQSYDRAAIEGRIISRAQLHSLYAELLPLSIPQRCSFSPLLERRGEIIREGLEISLALLDFLEIQKIAICGGGILDGAIQQMLPC
ncbi:MAG: hypothetical protein Q4B50_04715 [Bacillota bacterium]|nr:hypothetical protein [Bacillota bacterium]